MKRQLYTQVNEFLRDDDFIRYVLDSDASTVRRWEVYLSAEPVVRHAFLTACDVLMHLDDSKYLSEEETGRLKKRIFLSLGKEME